MTATPSQDEVGDARAEDVQAGELLAEAAADQQHPTLLRLRTGVALGTGASRGAMWTGSSRIAGQIFQFLGTIVTARLLLPSDYGKSAIIFSITAFATIFTDLGLGSGIVHAKRVTEELLSTAFWLNLLSGLFLTGAISALAFPISRFYGSAALVPLIVLASLNFTLDTDIVQTALLERTLRFRQLAIVETTSSVLTVVVMVVAAAEGAGAYSLVFGPLAASLLQVVWLWSIVRWRPRLWLDRRSLAQLWSFSRGITGFNVVNYWSRNLDNLLLGKVASQATLGAYTRSYNLMMLPVTQMGAALGRAIFPALSRLREHRTRLRRAWITAVAGGGVITFPVAIGIAVTAPALVTTLYGHRWVGMIPSLELLALSAPPQLVGATAGPLLRATGNTDQLFRRGLVTSAMSIVAIVAGLHWGALGVATGVLVKSWLALPVILVPCMKATGTRATALFGQLRGVLVATAALAAVTLGVRFYTGVGERTPEMLALQVVDGAVVYVLVLAAADRPLLDTTLQRFLPASVLGRLPFRGAGRHRRPAGETVPDSSGPVVVYALRNYPSLSQTFVRDEVFALRRAGARVRVVSLRPPDLRNIPDDWPGEYDEAPPRPLLSGVVDLLACAVAHPVRFVRLLRLVAALRRDAATSWLLHVAHYSRRLRRERVPVAAVHTHFAFANAPAALYLAALLGVPARITVHAADIYTDTERAVARLEHFEQVLTVCDFNVRFLREHGLRNPRVDVVPCGVALPPAAELVPLPAGDRTRIVSVGRLVPKKGFDVLLRAMRLVVDQVPGAQLWIVGDGPVGLSLVGLTSELGLWGSVELVGALPNRDVKALVAGADVFALACAVPADGNTDAVPVVIREAMAYARPVVTTSVAGIPETIDEATGWVVEPGDPAALAAALVEALTSDRAADRGLAARSRIEREFTVERSAERLRALVGE